MPKQIAELASKDDIFARIEVINLCKFGRKLTDIEQRIRSYYACMEDVEMSLSNKELGAEPRLYFDGAKEREITYKEACQLTLEHVQKGIHDIFENALNTGDAEKIIGMAGAVLFFKDKRGSKFRAVEHERGLLLIAKHRLEMYEQKWTIRQVAEYLAGDKKIPTPADGFSALRRKCHDLNFPLSESRKTSRK